MDAALDPTKIKITSNPYINVTGPPDGIDNASVAGIAAQLLQMFHPVAMIEIVLTSRLMFDSRPRFARSKFSSVPFAMGLA